ncbi:hypothetical protein E4T39_06242 [Aureobasidium subglaciale]|nr:hypothetical protein E4T39_06242 [Aureobasidium subglaciale]
MASLSQHYTYPMRPTNKDPQWATVYDDLFNQCIDTDGFEFGTCNAVAATGKSDEASNSEVIDSIEADFTDSGDSSSSEVAARLRSDDFWARTLAVLEESASTLEDEQDGSQQRERQQQHIHTLSSATSFYNTKDHPHAQFLSLGGFPSPHISNVPSSPSAEAAARRCKAGRYQQDRRFTKTPERPVGIKKAYRPSSKSPKMMSPSRYRLGDSDAWIGIIYQTPNRMTSMNLPLRSMPLTPPSSGRSKPAVGLGFQGFGDLDTSPFQPFTNYDEQRSPFSQTFSQQRFPGHLYSPQASPLISPSVERGAMFAEEPTVFRDIYYEQPIATATTVDLYNGSAWSANSFGAEDIYEPSPTFSPWMASERKEAEYQASLTHDYQVHNSLLSATCNDPTLAPAFGDKIIGGLDMQEQTPYYTTTSCPTTTIQRDSRTPSPPRIIKRKSSSKLQTHSRKSSNGERKSSRGKKAGGFVNYTPSDSEKLLTGVAPSGSSKTKARREREQADRWRRFSQAAAKAVADAGGVVTDVAPVASMMPLSASQTDGLDVRAGGDWS